MFQATKEINEKLAEWKSSYRFDHSSDFSTCRIVDLLTGQVWCSKKFGVGTREEDALTETVELAKTKTRPKTPAEMAIERASGLEEKNAELNAEIARLRSQLEASNKKTPARRGRPPRTESPVVEDPVDLGSSAEGDEDTD